MSNPTHTIRLVLPVGCIQGVRSVSGSGEQARALRIFKGIPYAVAPTGEHRWSEPKPVQPWKGTRVCQQFGALSVQAAATTESTYTGDLDCLSLNVWCPEGDREDIGLRPVMVWVPGGGFIRGGSSDALYDGCNVAKSGVVFVSINYRLGVDGFMHFDEASPNRGLQDQLAALRWVRENIKYFGGDADQITLAGVSAGAGSICHLMGLPQANSLFHRAILQSPSLQSHTIEDAQRVRQALAGVLGIPPTLTAIAQAPLTALTGAVASFVGNESLKRKWGLRPKNYFPLRPVIDGVFLKQAPLASVESNLENDAPLRPVLLGFNAQEMRFYLVPNGEIDRVDSERVRAFLDDIGWDPHSLDQYRDALISENLSAGWGDVLAAIQTDYYYRKPTLELARKLSTGGAKTYLYQFAWKSPRHEGRLGAAHAMEVPFVLGNTESNRAKEFIGTLAPHLLSNEMHLRWIQFAKGQSMPDWSNSASQLRLFE